MRLAGGDSWQIRVRRRDPLIQCALWVREAERIVVPDGPLVPGPAQLDPPPPRRSAPLDPAHEAAVGREWFTWWSSLVDPRVGRVPSRIGPPPEPAFDTCDPLGLARLPALRRVVARHWQPNPVCAIRSASEGRQPPGPFDTYRLVAEVQRSLGRPARPFVLDFWLLPVRDEVIRPVDERRYLVPEQVFDGPRWLPWLRALVARLA